LRKGAKVKTIQKKIMTENEIAKIIANAALQIHKMLRSGFWGIRIRSEGMIVTHQGKRVARGICFY